MIRSFENSINQRSLGLFAILGASLTWPLEGCRTASANTTASPHTDSVNSDQRTQRLNGLISDEDRPAALWLDRRSWVTYCGFVVCSDKQHLLTDSAPVLLEPSPQNKNNRLPPDRSTSTAFTEGLAKILKRRTERDWPIGSAQLHDLDFENHSDRIAIKQIYEVLRLASTRPVQPINVVADKYKPGTETVDSHGLTPVAVRQDVSIPCTDESIRKLQSQFQQPTFPLNCFHWIVSIRDSQGRITVKTDRQILDSNPRYVFTNSDVVSLLLGFHAMIADAPGWSWATFWWSKTPEPARTRDFPSHSEPAERVPWNRYRFATTSLGKSNQSSPVANPYLEAATGDGKSNCIFCHSRARIPNADFNGGGTPMPAAPLLPCYKVGDQAASPGGMATAEGCSDATVTHFLWTVARRKQFSEPKPKR